VAAAAAVLGVVASIAPPAMIIETVTVIVVTQSDILRRVTSTLIGIFFSGRPCS
jgi:hypothetical protein